MTQADDLGAIANQIAALYRARVNVNFQAVASQHYGASEPVTLYPNMVWFDSGTGYVKLRNPTNTAWQTIGTIGPPMKFTNVDIPDTAWATGDVKISFNPVAPSGWIAMNDGTLGDGSSGATTRANPDTQALFELLWAWSIDDWLQVFAAGTYTRTGRGASAAADFAAHRHMLIPKALGRVLACYGVGAGLGGVGLSTWHGAQQASLAVNQIPAHAHSFTVPAHNHALARSLPNYVGGKGSVSGGYTIADQQSGVTWTENSGGVGGTTGSAGSGDPYSLMQPTTYAAYFMKL